MADHTISDAGKLTGWRKSSYSGNDAGTCLEILDGHPSGIPVRDSKTPHDLALVFPTAAWSVFVSAVKATRIN